MLSALGEFNRLDEKEASTGFHAMPYGGAAFHFPLFQEKRNAQKAPPRRTSLHVGVGVNDRYYGDRCLHHAAHAAHTGGTHRHFRMLLLLVADDALGSEEHACHRGCVFKGYAGYLGGVNHAG